MTRADRCSATGDEGFTLVELLVSIAILGIIMGAISAAMITFLRTGTYASERDDHSAGAILLSSYLDRDLASADTVAITTKDASPASKIASECGGSSEFTLTWRDYTASSAAPIPVASTVYTASYTVVPYNDVFEGVTRVRCRLTRAYSIGGGAPDTTIIAEDLFNGTGSSDTPRAIVATTVAPPTSGSCAATTKFTVAVRQYEGDTASPYNYAGCVKGRVS
jgi:prepilin-type N-terminal cleavage/methylation domain-containing protein